MYIRQVGKYQNINGPMDVSGGEVIFLQNIQPYLTSYCLIYIAYYFTKITCFIVENKTTLLTMIIFTLKKGGNVDVNFPKFLFLNVMRSRTEPQKIFH